jgi:predicted ATPase
MWLGFMAEAQAAAGQIDAAFATLDQAVDATEATSEMVYQAELNRLIGALLMKKGDRSDAEKWLRQALNLAETQGAKSLALRAATSLANLWRSQNRHAEARDLLAPSTDGSPRASIRST